MQSGGKKFCLILPCFVIADCPAQDQVCQEDVISLDAIRSLHKKIDDDESGNIDIEESQGVSS